MKILRLFVSNYKNLVDCELTPSGVHAITGCNSTGKSNLLEVLPFVAELISGSDVERERLLESFNSDFGEWRTIIDNEFDPSTLFKIEMSCELDISGLTWSVDYSLDLSFRGIDEDHTAMVFEEQLLAKQSGKPGKARILLERDRDGNTTSYLESNPRKPEHFKTKGDMSALQAIKVRQADDFEANYPVIATFVKALSDSRLVRLDPEKFKTYMDYSRKGKPDSKPGRLILAYDPFTFLLELRENRDQWKRFLDWTHEIAGIEDIEPAGVQFAWGGAKPEDSPPIPTFILFRHQGRGKMVQELSMGTITVLGIVLSLFSSMNTGGTVLIEEPENHLHPQAIIKMIEMFREFSDQQDILFTTHSPVVLNSLRPSEVTVMQPVENGLVTARKVDDIQEALEALDRGFLSMGDLLQTNFKDE